MCIHQTTTQFSRFVFFAFGARSSALTLHGCASVRLVIISLFGLLAFLAFLAVVVLACERSRVALGVLWCEFGDDDHAHVLDVELLVEVKDRNAVVRSLEAHNLAVVDSGPCTRR